jgi:hypothetical protein
MFQLIKAFLHSFLHISWRNIVESEKSLYICIAIKKVRKKVAELLE